LEGLWFGIYISIAIFGCSKAYGCGDSGELCATGLVGVCGAKNAVWELRETNGETVCSEEDLFFGEDPTNTLTLDWGGMLGDGHTFGLGFYLGEDKTQPGPVFDFDAAMLAVAEPPTGCERISNSREMQGRLALIRRGSCWFSEKFMNAQNAGAIGVIVWNIEGPYNVGVVGNEWPVGTTRYSLSIYKTSAGGWERAAPAAQPADWVGAPADSTET
jgi:hypothetical protein